MRASKDLLARQMTGKLTCAKSTKTCATEKPYVCANKSVPTLQATHSRLLPTRRRKKDSSTRRAKRLTAQLSSPSSKCSTHTKLKTPSSRAASTIKRASRLRCKIGHQGVRSQKLICSTFRIELTGPTSASWTSFCHHPRNTWPSRGTEHINLPKDFPISVPSLSINFSRMTLCASRLRDPL